MEAQDMKAVQQLPKIFMLSGLVVAYLLCAAVLLVMVNSGVIHREPPEAPPLFEGSDTDALEAPTNLSVTLASALSYVERNLREKNGHINLYQQLSSKAGQQDNDTNNDTNSEAVS